MISKDRNFLDDAQLDAIRKMKNGCILNGGVGSGKSRTALAYYFFKNGGHIEPEYVPIDDVSSPLLYIITTAKKRDSNEWEKELAIFLMSTDASLSLYRKPVIVDSWNNIGKYVEVKDAFFIFDEDRVTGRGAWVKSFLKITKNNEWIILSATPGDDWQSYVPVFIANGFFKNRTEFNKEHVVFSPYVTKFPKIDGYMNTGKLIRLRNKILVDIDYKRHTEHHHVDVNVSYDPVAYKSILKDRWNFWKEEPIANASDVCYCLRRVCNEDISRRNVLLRLAERHKRIIVFYSYDYELDILKNLDYGSDFVIAEWNGHKHQEIPKTDTWIYLVNYTAGCEGWNCCTTDTIVFYSQTYSYKTLVQAAGRIDRRNSPYHDLYYYHFVSKSGIDLAIKRALRNKKKFNERKFVEG